VSIDERAERLHSRTNAPVQSNLMLGLFADEHPDIFDIIATDFRAGMALWPDLELRILQDQGEGDGSCSVADVYLGRNTPKIIGVASASPARMLFTGLHELGHHIQRSHDQLLESLLGRPDQGRVLEEAACDLFAALLLLPQPDVDAALGDSTPTALAVRELWQEHNASRAAAAVAAVQKLSADGHVLILNGSGVVEFAASRSLPRLRRGSDQGQTDLIRKVLGTQSDRVQGQTRLRYRDSISGEKLWFQAAHDGGECWFVVASTEHVPWERLSLPILDEKTVKGYWWTCELCGHTWESFAAKHQPCGTPVCESCDRCSCRNTALKVRTCEKCFIEKSINEFVGDSRNCIDC
jgi:hypothetical protein